MSKEEYNKFGQSLAFHIAPTLLGIKCASLLSLLPEEFDLDFHTELFNHKTAAKGLKCRTLCNCGKRVLVLFYNESERLLKKILHDKAVCNTLKGYGYKINEDIDNQLCHLAYRIKTSICFPHEIGIFLGYPIEDVIGFIENKGENFKLCGTWKVYGDEKSAKHTFDNYVKCRNFLCNKLNEGADIYQALRIS